MWSRVVKEAGAIVSQENKQKISANAQVMPTPQHFGLKKPSSGDSIFLIDYDMLQSYRCHGPSNHTLILLHISSVQSQNYVQTYWYGGKNTNSHTNALTVVHYTKNTIYQTVSSSKPSSSLGPKNAHPPPSEHQAHIAKDSSMVHYT